MSDVPQLIDELSRLRTDDSMSRVAASAKAGNLGAEEICCLADAMARSGVVLRLGSAEPTADLASTGAPSSLSTLLAPLYLCCLGLVVPKLGVPGRPAGGIDVLAQLPGYKYQLGVTEIREVVARCGYAHFLAGENFAPLDAVFFRYRQKAAAQDIPSLAAASLLAKKIASGVQYAGLDVRVAPHGNFGRTFEEAAEAARMFCDAARLSGIRAVAILTDARTPYQPFIGRGEALVALHGLFAGKADAWLAEHNDRCHLMAGHIAALVRREPESSGQEIADVFRGNLEAQGSSMEAFAAKVEAVTKDHRYEVLAPHEGFFRLDLARLRSIFVAVHATTNAARPFPDDLGLILQVRPGAYVRRGDTLASVRIDDARWHEIRVSLDEAFQAADLLDYAPGMEEVVRA